LGFKINIATYLDNKHYVRGNFYAIGGGFLSGNERSYTDTIQNLNFKSSVLAFGFNADYDFDRWISPQRRLRPFISLGVEIVTFDTKTDYYNEDEGEVQYHYWPDGSIRNEAFPSATAGLMRRDYKYESSIKSVYDFGYEGDGDYSGFAIAVPAEIGLDYQITDRVLFKIATSVHYTFSDEIDHVSHKNTHTRIGDPINDWFTFTYFTIHLDLFSSDKVLTSEKFFADVDLDLTMIGDEDGDGYFDAMDRCPGTPFGVEVDTAGCPLDADIDRVPDYLDDEPNSRYGAFVDERGVEMSEEDVITSLDMSKAVPRTDVAMYIRTPSSYSNYKKAGAKEIPEKFAGIDGDADGYISYEEMMNAIDSFFEFESDLNSDDIHELNDFFFAQ